LRKHVGVNHAIVTKRFEEMDSFAREKEKATSQKKKKLCLDNVFHKTLL
jgi:hypothetical protein